MMMKMTGRIAVMTMMMTDNGDYERSDGNEDYDDYDDEDDGSDGNDDDNNVDE